MIKYMKLETIDAIRTVIASNTQYSCYARLADRNDCYLYDVSGVRLVNDQLQINAGEWSYAKNGYINDEWLTPRFVYMKHYCDGCTYPPDMCCLQPIKDNDSEFYQDDLDAALDRWYVMPPVIPVTVEE